tara:strand:+ start:996 stop:1766 length:771 start_codon:yes stop_codon:yes gene_type:complete
MLKDIDKIIKDSQEEKKSLISSDKINIQLIEKLLFKQYNLENNLLEIILKEIFELKDIDYKDYKSELILQKKRLLLDQYNMDLLIILMNNLSSKFENITIEPIDNNIKEIFNIILLLIFFKSKRDDIFFARGAQTFYNILKIFRSIKYNTLKLNKLIEEYKISNSMKLEYKEYQTEEFKKHKEEKEKLKSDIEHLIKRLVLYIEPKTEEINYISELPLLALKMKNYYLNPDKIKAEEYIYNIKLILKNIFELKLVI